MNGLKCVKNALLSLKMKHINNIWMHDSKNENLLINEKIDGFEVKNNYIKFNGSRYEKLFTNITGFSLRKNLSNKDLKNNINKIKKYIDGVKKHNCEIENLTIKEAEDFLSMLEKYESFEYSLYCW